MLTILIVDDSAADRAIIGNMLGDYDVLYAKDGFEAMEILEKHDAVHLMILDLNMPGMDGFQVLEAMNTSEKYRDIRTIILTNYDELDNEIKGLGLGAVDYIRKPIHMASLRARIQVHAKLLHIKHALEKEMQKQESTLDVIFSQVPVGIAISFNKDPASPAENKYFTVNPAFEKMMGRTREELTRVGWAAITHPQDLQQNLAYYERLQAEEIRSYQMEKRFIKPDGSVVWVHFLTAAFRVSEVHPYNHIALFQDITEKKLIEERLIESERSKETLLSHLPGMAYRCSYDREWTMWYVSAGCLMLTEYEPDSLIDNRDLSFNDLIAPEYRQILWLEWERATKRRESFSHEFEIITKSGNRKWVLEMGQAVYDENGEVEALEGIIIDVSDRKAIEDILKFNNDHDRWTGLLNRDVLERMLQKDMSGAKTGKRALININLTLMQTLTTKFGFHYAQSITNKVARSLQSICGADRVLFITYDNRFVVYIRNYRDRAELDVFLVTLRQSLESILLIERVGGGIGVLELDPKTSRSADEILMDVLITSEIALRNSYGDFPVRFFDAEVQKGIIREKTIEEELVLIETDTQDSGLSLVYQPILDLRTNRITGFEALARLQSRTFGLVSPLEFIPIAERTKQIIPIGYKVFSRAFHFLKKLEENGFGDISVSVNVSVIQLLKQGFLEDLLALVEEMDAAPENIGIEITESAFSGNYTEINRILAALKKTGMRVYIDDFGIGYSSFARESELNVDCLKIDKYFVDKLLLNDAQNAITLDIISIAKRMNHGTVAEGVEHEKQIDLLKAYGCEKAQGFLISKPLPDDAAIEILVQQRHRGGRWAAKKEQ